MFQDLLEQGEELMERGPTNPKAMYRYGSRPNQAPLMRLVRDFLSSYASAGNKAMQGEEADISGLEGQADEIKGELDELLKSARQQSR